jgi:Ferritin-like domain
MSISRRRLITASGATMAMAAVLAACVGGESEKDAEPGPPTRTRGDVTLLRTASSIELVGLVAYDIALDSGLIETPAVADLVRLARAHHEQHAALFAGATRELGGAAFREPNPAVLEQFKSSINGLADEASILTLGRNFETIAAQTYQAFVNEFREASLGIATASIGGAEARHAAAMVALLGEAAVPAAFQTTERAVEPGTGL